MCIEDKRAEKIIIEADAWFRRNMKDIEHMSGGGTIGAHIILDFLKSYCGVYPNSITKMLEVGSSFGYNLDYLSKELDVDVYGIEASNKAVEYGNIKYNNNKHFHLNQGVSDDLPYEEGEFEVVIAGFFLYATPRNIVNKSMMELDRVLKEGGFLIITDFDTPYRCVRKNIHTEALFTYKEDYSKPLLEMGYSLVEKKSYSHNGDVFNPIIQERVSTQILYKEKKNDLYSIS